LPHKISQDLRPTGPDFWDEIASRKHFPLGTATNEAVIHKRPARRASSGVGVANKNRRPAVRLQQFAEARGATGSNPCVAIGWRQAETF
jgi:hypothetical protein